MCVFLISPVPIAEPLTSELIDTPVFYNLAPRPIKYRVSVPIPTWGWVIDDIILGFLCFYALFMLQTIILRYIYMELYFVFYLNFLQRKTTLKIKSQVGVDRLSAPILSILPIIDIGHFQNRFADNFFIYIFFLYYANKHTIYRWHYLLVNK